MFTNQRLITKYAYGKGSEKRFVDLCETLGITTRFLGFVQRPVFQKLENKTFRKLDVFPSSGKGAAIEVCSFLDTQLSRRLPPPSPEHGNRSSFRNVMFSSFLEYRTMDKIQ
jgi:hypothetical protein